MLGRWRAMLGPIRAWRAERGEGGGEGVGDGGGDGVDDILNGGGDGWWVEKLR